MLKGHAILVCIAASNPCACLIHLQQDCDAMHHASTYACMVRYTAGPIGSKPLQCAHSQFDTLLQVPIRRAHFRTWVPIWLRLGTSRHLLADRPEVIVLPDGGGGVTPVLAAAILVRCSCRVRPQCAVPASPAGRVFTRKLGLENNSAFLAAALLTWSQPYDITVMKLFVPASHLWHSHTTLTTQSPHQAVRRAIPVGTQFLPVQVCLARKSAAAELKCALVCIAP